MNFSKIFQFVYCLPLRTLAAVVAALSVIFCLLRNRYGQKTWWKILVYAGLAAGLVLIYAQTLYGRSPDEIQQSPILTLFHTYRALLAGGSREILRMNFMNTVLVYPAGLFLCEVLPKKWSGTLRLLLTMLLLGMLCAGVEYGQYFLSLGMAEIDDVFHNTLGAFAGALVCLYPWRKKK